MRIPKYRKHSKGQARVTIKGRDFLLGPYGSPESHAAYKTKIAELLAAPSPEALVVKANDLTMAELCLAYLDHAQEYYQGSTEFVNLELALNPVSELYANLAAVAFGVNEFRTVREWWINREIEWKPRKTRSKKEAARIAAEPLRPARKCSRQYINKQMKRLLRVIKWGVGQGMIPPAILEALRCVEPLKRGRTTAPESKKITCVEQSRVDATLGFMTPILADMVRFQQLVGCRPGELCRITPGMVDHSADVWEIELSEHKTAYRDKARTIYVGPQGQAVLLRYLNRGKGDACFSPAESEQQRREAMHAARVTPLSCGNKPGSNRIAREPKKQPGKSYTAGTYARAVLSACKRAKIQPWAPNQLRHNRATVIRKEFGIEAASVTLGHSGLEVTQVYAEADRQKAIEVAKAIG